MAKHAYPTKSMQHELAKQLVVAAAKENDIRLDGDAQERRR
jgi:hypothetical protein